MTSTDTRDSGGELFVVQHGDVGLAGERWTAETARGTVIMLHGGG